MEINDLRQFAFGADRFKTGTPAIF